MIPRPAAERKSSIPWGWGTDCKANGSGPMMDVFQSFIFPEHSMSRLALALLSTILFAGMAPEARAAAAVCDAAACIAKYCKGAIASNAQRCNSNCQITAADNKKKGLCK
jgi:hypothetical protein